MPPSQSPTPPAPWPPDWARSVAFFVGLGLMTFEAVIDQSAHLAAYGPAFALTGLPIVKGVEVMLDKLGALVGKSPSPPPDPPVQS